VWPEGADASFSKAKYHGKTGICKTTYGPKTIGKTRYDQAFRHVWNNTCWSCPAGYKRTANPDVKSRNACRKAGKTSYTRARKHRKVKFLGKCPKGQFVHTLNQTCYSCPSKYRRSGNPHVAGKNACVRKISAKRVAAKYRGRPPQGLCPAGKFFDPRKGGECWSCPTKWHRTINPVTSTKACASRFTQIFAVDSAAMCKSVIGGLRSGTKGAQKLKKTLDTITGPVLKPVQRAIARAIPPLESPRELDRLLGKIGAAMRQQPAVIKEVARVGTIVQRNPGRLGNIFLDPVLMCEGGRNKINQALIRAGINPNFQSKRASLFDGMLIKSAQAATPRGFHVVSFSSGGRPADKPAGTAITVSVVTNFSGGKFGLFISAPALILATQPGLDFSVGYMYFAKAKWENFDQIGQLGIEVEIGLGNALKTVMGKAGNIPHWPNVAFVTSADPAFFVRPKDNIPGFGFSMNWTWNDDEGKKPLRIRDWIDVSASGDYTHRIAPN
jgi:hypothetical protein